MAWIEKHGHGGDLYSAAENFQLDPEQLLDFSANINPLGPPQKVMETLHENMKSIVHYPDPSQRNFRKTLANLLNVSTTWLLVGNGAAECMALTIQGLKPKNIGIIYPCFSEYEKLAKMYGARIQSCYGEESNAYKPNMDDCFDLFMRSELVFIGHPNNPTGVSYTKDELLKFAEWTKDTKTYLVVDEAFIDFVPFGQRYSLLDKLEKYPSVILIRSMTKFYAIPGLRLGYMVGHPTVINKVRDKQVTWSVNQLALAAGEACFFEKEYEKITLDLIKKERNYLTSEITNWFGLEIFPGQANFLLIRLPKQMKVNDFQFKLGKQGIMIRSCAMYPGLTEQDFRIAVRTRRENMRLLEGMKNVLFERG